jgi:pyruvate dehydrogenase E2 component (dihydrolipoamide acetyltransferase)
MADFCMPSLGADMDAGTLVEWRVAPGARVKRGDVVALVETQKGIVEIEIWHTGTIADLRVQPGAKVPVGTVLATVREDGDGAPAGTAARASPAARSLAREKGVDLGGVHGTGPHGAVTRDDVLRALTPAASPAPGAAPAPAAAPAATRSGMRDAIAAAMARSKREIPHYYLGADLDVTRAVRWLEAQNAKRPVTERILFAALLVKATALALRGAPELNGFFVDGAFRPSTAIHVGVAIALRQGGLVAPAIHDAGEKTLAEIMASLQDLVTRARAGSLKSSEMSDPTVTLTSLGELGTDWVFGVIYPPQVALVGFGAVRERPWAEGGMLGVRSVVTASLAGDHRVSDGHRGARFLAALGKLLGDPEAL